MTPSPITEYSCRPAIPNPPATTVPVLMPKCKPKSVPRAALKSSNAADISNAARKARSASFSWVSGAPNSAITPSPINLSSVPWYFSITGTSRSKQSFIKSRTASGSRLSENAVKPATSANITVMNLRSPRKSAAEGAGRARAANLARKGARARSMTSAPNSARWPSSEAIARSSCSRSTMGAS